MMHVVFLTAKPVHVVFSAMLASHFGRHVNSHLLQASRYEGFNALATLVPGFESRVAFHTPGYGVRAGRKFRERNARDMGLIIKHLDGIRPDVLFMFSISKPLNREVSDHVRRAFGTKVIFLEVSNSIHTTLSSPRLSPLRRLFRLSPPLARLDACMVRRPEKMPAWFTSKCHVSSLPPGIFRKSVADTILNAWGQGGYSARDVMPNKVILYLGSAPGRKNHAAVMSAESECLRELASCCENMNATLVLKPHPRLTDELPLPTESQSFKLHEDAALPGELLPGLYDIAGVVTIDSSAAQNLNFLYGIPAAYVYPMFEVEGLYLPSFKHEVLIQSSSDLKYFARDCLSVVPPGDHVAPADSSGTCKGWLRDIGLA